MAAAVTMAPRVYADLGDEVCSHGIYKRCCKPCWTARHGPWEFVRESSVVKQERLALSGVSHLWRSNGFRRKAARLAYHVAETGFYSSALPVRKLERPVEPIIFRTEVALPALLLWRRHHKKPCSGAHCCYVLTHGHATIDSITVTRSTPAKVRRWDTAWRGTPHVQVLREGEPWLYILTRNGVIESINGGPLFSLIPTVLYEKKFVTPRKDYWRPSAPITGEITRRTLADSRRKYVVNFEDFAAEFQTSPKNEDWRRFIRAVTRGCVCRICLTARFPRLFRLWTPRANPTATDYRKLAQEMHTSVRDTPPSGERWRGAVLRRSVGFHR